MVCFEGTGKTKIHKKSSFRKVVKQKLSSYKVQTKFSGNLKGSFIFLCVYLTWDDLDVKRSNDIELLLHPDTTMKSIAMTQVVSCLSWWFMTLQ